MNDEQFEKIKASLNFIAFLLSVIIGMLFTHIALL